MDERDLSKATLGESPVSRRSFLTGSAALAAASTLGNSSAAGAEPTRDARPPETALGASGRSERTFNQAFEGEFLNQVAFPLGGLGAGMICIEGSGALSNVSIRNQPDLTNEPAIFAAVAIKGGEPIARILQGPVQARKIFGLPNSGLGEGGTIYGLPRFKHVSFQARFPFAGLSFSEPGFPICAKLTAWSPFEPGDADDSSLPVAALEYSLTNLTLTSIDAVFSFNLANFFASDDHPSPNGVQPFERGVVLWSGPGEHEPWKETAFAATIPGSDVTVDHCWFRGMWWQDALTAVWKNIARGGISSKPPVPENSPGASLFVQVSLPPGEVQRIVVQLAWYCARSSLRFGIDPPNMVATVDTYKPWYAGRFKDVREVASYCTQRFEELRAKSLRFSEALFSSTLPPEAIEAVAANLSILKSPTVLRQTDGRLWGFEGVRDSVGSCPGSCTHVWNYAQSVSHLFPALERTLRDTEFGPSQTDSGRQVFRSAIPIRPSIPGETDAADGQLGGIIKVYREWRICGDTDWLEAIWPRVRQSLAYAIRTWDPEHTGVLQEPHHNTYDIEFWGPEPMCSGLYLGALQAADLMSRALGESSRLYEELIDKGKRRLEGEHFNGEYFYQRVRNDVSDRYIRHWESIKTVSPEVRELVRKEGPNYQYGAGCLSDGMLGVWLATISGLPHPLSADKVGSHLGSVHRYNWKMDSSNLANTERPSYAIGEEAGLRLCSWPRGGQPLLPMIFSEEVWTGIEYQVASHLIEAGRVEEGLQIVRACRTRYDGRVRNPFDEYECGHYYARAMSSYALLQALSGARFDAVDKVMYLRPRIKGDFRSFISVATGYGIVGVRNGLPFVEVVSGTIPFGRIDYVAAELA